MRRVGPLPLNNVPARFLHSMTKNGGLSLVPGQSRPKALRQFASGRLEALEAKSGPASFESSAFQIVRF
jgi:hypothetical protein